MIDVALNLVAAAIGFVISQLFTWARATLRRRDRRWFWQYHQYKKVTILVGSLKRRESGGEIEPSMNLVDALTLGEIQTFLAEHFSQVKVVTDEKMVDWAAPVVSLGGPLANAMTARLGTSGSLPLWFKGLPYGSVSTREIAGHGMSFTSTFDSAGLLTQDVGFIAKLSSEKSKSVPVFVLASNYGAGNHGVARLTTSDEGLSAIRDRVGKRSRFQVVVQSTVNDNLSVSPTVIAVLDAS